jgi:hypothetical protein
MKVEGFDAKVRELNETDLQILERLMNLADPKRERTPEREQIGELMKKKGNAVRTAMMALWNKG